MESIKVNYAGNVLQLYIEPIWNDNYLILSGHNETTDSPVNEKVLGIIEQFYQPQIQKIHAEGVIGSLGFCTY